MYTGKRVLLGGLFGVMLLVLPFHGEAGEYLIHRVPLDGSASSSVHGDEWIVQEITIEKGTTLWKFSRTYLGRGYFYPHLLAYNDIANPNRIYEGKTILVPVAKVRDYQKRNELQGKTWSVNFTDLALESASRAPVKKLAVRLPSKKEHVKLESSRDRAVSEQREFDRAKAEFEAGKYKEAARLFEGFASHHPRSSLKAEALFYAAEAQLKASEIP